VLLPELDEQVKKSFPKLVEMYQTPLTPEEETEMMRPHDVDVLPLEFEGMPTNEEETYRMALEDEDIGPCYGYA